MADGKKVKALSIVIVDSGMGGLSICADLVNGFLERSSHDQVDLVYFNAWPDQNRGYNTLPSHEDRIRVFNSALESIEKLQPDMILIACNTLSILYPETPLAAGTKIPVIGIIDFGVRMVHEQLRENPHSQAIILGTLTTVTSETHKKALVDMGISEERIIGQHCDQLATRIESGPEAKAVSEMIDGFLKEAAPKIVRNDAPVYAVFSCTHFGYAEKPFTPLLRHYFGERVEILNPNRAMAEHVLNLFETGQAENTDVRLRVLSRIVWDEVKVEAIATTLEKVSPATANALRTYHQDPGLFEI